jgi:hypothetical protein
MKALLAREERAYPHLYANLLHAMRPLLGERQAQARARRETGNEG